MFENLDAEVKGLHEEVIHLKAEILTLQRQQSSRRGLEGARGETGSAGPAGRDARVEIRNVDGRVLIVENDQVRAEIISVAGPEGKVGPKGEGERGLKGETGAAGHTPTEVEVAAIVRKLFSTIAKAA